MVVQVCSQFWNDVCREQVLKDPVGVTDMVLLADITEEEILKNVQARFNDGEIYTYIGHVVVSVNPLVTLPSYATSPAHVCLPPGCCVEDRWEVGVMLSCPLGPTLSTGSLPVCCAAIDR